MSDATTPLSTHDLAGLTRSDEYLPWDHQEAGFQFSADRTFVAVAAEQRTGKTRIILGKAVHHYLRSEITALVVIAMPGDVHANWVTDEVPAWLPPGLPRRCFIWRSDRAALKSTAEELERLRTFPGLAILAVNGEAILSVAFRRYLGQFIKTRQRVMVVADEQTLIMKAPYTARRGSRRSKVMMSIAKLPQVVYKVIMDGTPVGEGPFDLWTSYEFLKPGGGLLGPRGWTEFKTTYAEYEEATVYQAGERRTFQRVKGYKNLEQLNELMMRHTFRVRRKDCMDLPEKIHVPIHRFELSREQRRVYDALRDDYVAEFDRGLPVTAANVLTRYLRLQQVTSNFIPAVNGLALCPACLGDGCEACDDLGALETTVPARRVDEEHHPRLDALKDQVASFDEPTIVWARFRQDVDDVMHMLAAVGRHPVRYDGAASPEEKLAARRAFQAGEATDLVGSARAGGRGLRLSRAGSIHYYSNEFPLLLRLQSEDRAEADGKTRGTGIHDYAADDTVDEKIIQSLRDKRSLVDLIMGEESGGWL